MSINGATDIVALSGRVAEDVMDSPFAAGRNSSPTYKWSIRKAKPNKRLVTTLATSSDWEEFARSLQTKKAFPSLLMKWAIREAESDNTQVRELLWISQKKAIFRVLLIHVDKVGWI
jgi:hypothetical protein